MAQVMPAAMLYLLSNDDGHHAPGLAALRRAAGRSGRVAVVAPAEEQSAKSHAFTMLEPLRVERVGPMDWKVRGTPADCVYLALHQLLDREPGLVLSGINRGSNLGQDVHYSGTVAAAIEACLHGYAAIAFSLHTAPGDTELHWETAEQVVERVLQGVASQPIPPGTMLNVNVPNCRPEDLRGLAAASLGRRIYDPAVHVRADPRGMDYFWIGGPHTGFDPAQGTDGPEIAENWASVTPLHPDLTWKSRIEALRAWTDR